MTPDAQMAPDRGGPARGTVPTVARPAPTVPTATRRQALLAAGVGAGALTLAACGSSASPPTSSSASASGPSASSAGPSAAAGGVTLVALSSVPVGQAVAATLDGKPVIVAQPTAGQAVAFSAICTHLQCTVAPKGNELDCPCHGSKYNALTGAVTQGPAPRALDSITVTVKDGQVVTA